jgi:hypothetical protein
VSPGAASLAVSAHHALFGNPRSQEPLHRFGDLTPYLRCLRIANRIGNLRLFEQPIDRLRAAPAQMIRSNPFDLSVIGHSRFLGPPSPTCLRLDEGGAVYLGFSRDTARVEATCPIVLYA